ARGVLILSSLLLIAIIPFHEPLASLALRCSGTTPFAIGIGSDREAVVATLSTHTSAEARILWEDRPGQSITGRWTALLPILTDRAFLGGLDANAGIEHEQTLRFAQQQLAGRWLRDWKDVELDDFFRRYNVGWVVCWSPGAISRLQQC